MRASDLKHITPDAWTQNHNSNLNFPVQSKATFSFDVFLWKELRQHSKLREPQICMTMCKRIQRELWQAWSRNLHFAAFNITSHYGTKKCRKTTVPQTEIGKVRVHSSRPRLNSDARPLGHKTPKYKTQREKKVNEGVMSYWFALKNGIFWITLNNAEDNALFTRKPNVWVRWESLPFTEAAQKIPDLYYTKWSSSRIKDTTNYITLWCTVHKTYHHISSESPTLTESFHY